MVKDKNGNELHVGDIVVVDSPMQNMCNLHNVLFKDMLEAYWQETYWEEIIKESYMPYTDAKGKEIKSQYNRWIIKDIETNPQLIPQNRESTGEKNNLILKAAGSMFHYGKIGCVSSSKVHKIGEGKRAYAFPKSGDFYTGQPVAIGKDFNDWQYILAEREPVLANSGQRLAYFIEDLGFGMHDRKFWKASNHWKFVKEKELETVAQPWPFEEDWVNDCIIQNTSNTPLNGIFVAVCFTELVPTNRIQRTRAQSQSAVGGGQLQGRIPSTRSFYQLKKGLKKTNEAIQRYGLNKKEK